MRPACSRVIIPTMTRRGIERKRFTVGALACGVAVLMAPATARADAGIPMLPVAYPVLFIYLIPVIAIESIYLRFRLHTRWRNTILATAGANALTMLVGFPLAWVICFVAELALGYAINASGISAHIPLAANSPIWELLGAVLGAPWMGPVFPDRWPILVAFVALLIPSFLLSAFVEARLLDRRGWLDSELKSSRAVWQANVLSYLFLAVAGCFLLWLWLGGFHPTKS